MKNDYLPIPTGWKMLLREAQRWVLRQVNSPWTKLAVLVAVFVLATRDHLSVTISFGSPSVFAGVPTDQQLGMAQSTVLTSYAAPEKQWTARQLKQLAYAKQYAGVAQREMLAHGIPASITLAQGLLESGTGRSSLATKNNNHFGIKCFSKQCAKGHCSNHSDDHHKDFFRIYDNPESSYRDHSKILLKERYRRLFQLSMDDYKGWARGLKSAGYATDPRYADKLIAMIEDLDLQRFDRVPAK